MWWMTSASTSRSAWAELARLEGGVGRDNLSYEVRQVPVQAKYADVLRLLQEALQEEGGAIVFCARQKTVEELARFLKEGGLDCGYFHGGMLPADKRRVQEAFLSGSLRVIAATNAFGMGVDKPDVRLVIHLDTPGSLENYLQEAGRAGRDQAPARCILLYDEADLDVQFRLLKNSRLSQHDILSILKALRAIERKDRSEGEVVVTSGEILLEVPESHSLDPDANDADTKVRIAVAWLEEARLLERHENHTRVFPGSLLVASMDEAITRLRHKLGADADIAPYLQILSILMQAADDEGLSTDDLMLATGSDSRRVQAMLRELDKWQVLSNDTEIGRDLVPGPGQHPAHRRTRAHRGRAAGAPAGAGARCCEMKAGRSSTCAACATPCGVTPGWISTPSALTRLLKSFAEPFGDGDGQRGFFALRPAGRTAATSNCCAAGRRSTRSAAVAWPWPRCCSTCSCPAVRATPCSSPANRASWRPPCRPT
jgi:ATP-dependent DNA helicase RecQ